MALEPGYWRRKRLAEMSAEEWEALCDGCGKCCLVLLRDDATGAVHETDVACRLYAPATRRCADYAKRHERVPDCVRMTAENVASLTWMPPTCAYRLVAGGEDLPNWHPLRTGDARSVDAAGAAAPKGLVSEDDVAFADLEDHVVGLREPGRRRRP
ncbi:MAG: YcgN family cysteine cluster protein [Parvularculaceae bacterium]|nr:YcgN family cysteine cluster protein [Parvularculaceae bacterium]